MRNNSATILARADAEYGHSAVPPYLWLNCVDMVVAASGSQDATRLDHQSVSDSILLCEALNWAAKVWSQEAYKYKEALVRYTVGLMDETGEGAAARREDTDDDYDWVIVLEHPAVGSAGFHGVCGEWAARLPETRTPWSGHVRQHAAFATVAAWVRGDKAYFAHMHGEAEAARQKTLRWEQVCAARDHAADAAYEVAASSGAATPAARQAVVQRAWTRILELKEEFPEIEEEEGAYGWFACQLDEPAVEAAVLARARGESIPRRCFSSWVNGRYANWGGDVTGRSFSNGFEDEPTAPRPRLTDAEARRRRFYFPEWGVGESRAPIPTGSLARFRYLEPADGPTTPTAEPPPRSRRFHGIEFAD